MHNFYGLSCDSYNVGENSLKTCASNCFIYKCKSQWIDIKSNSMVEPQHLQYNAIHCHENSKYQSRYAFRNAKRERIKGEPRRREIWRQEDDPFGMYNGLNQVMLYILYCTLYKNGMRAYAFSFSTLFFSRTHSIICIDIMQIRISSFRNVLLILTQNFPFKERIFPELKCTECRMQNARQ